MPLMYQANTLLMEWCIGCHRAPENNLRPKSEVFSMSYAKPSEDHPVAAEPGGKLFTDQVELGLELKRLYKISDEDHMTKCSVCHR